MIFILNWLISITNFQNHENKKILTIKIKTAIKQKILTPLIFHKTNKKTIKHLKKISLNFIFTAFSETFKKILFNHQPSKKSWTIKNLVLINTTKPLFNLINKILNQIKKLSLNILKINKNPKVLK